MVVDGAELRKRRLAASLSAEELGALAGLTGTTVRKIENGHKARPATLTALEAALLGKESEAVIVAEVLQTATRPDLVARIKQLEAEFSDLKTLVLRLLAERAR